MFIFLLKMCLLSVELCEEEEAEADSPDMEPGTEMDQGELSVIYGGYISIFIR